MPHEELDDLQRVGIDDRAGRCGLVDHKDVIPGAGDGNVKNFAAFRMRRWIVRPDERRIMLRAVQDDAIELLALALVHVHDMDAIERVTA